METQEKVQKSCEILTFISRLVGTLFAVHWGKEKKRSRVLNKFSEVTS